MSKDREDKFQDLTTYGVSFSKRGQRIDPRDVYISTEPEQEPVAWMWEFAVRSSWDASFTGEWKEEISRIKPDGIVKGFNPTKLERTVRNLIPLYKAHGIGGGE